MAFNFTWNASFLVLPSDPEAASLGASRIRDLKSALNERLIVDHVWSGVAADGTHQQVTFSSVLAVDPATVAGTGYLYTKLVNNAVEAFYKDAAGNVVQLTSAGFGSFITGEVKAVAFSSAVKGWLPCDGSAVSRTTYAALYAAIGTTWGVGDGVTTFNVPDFRGRTLVGDGTGPGNGGGAPALTPRTVGQQTFGEEAHALTVAELAAHNHTITDPGHTHTSNAGGQTGVTGPGSSAVPVMQPGTATTSSTTGISINNNGSGTAHNVMQPSAVIHWIIKT